MVIGPVNHGYLELVCREIVCMIRDIEDLPRPVRRGSRKGVAHRPWFTEPPKKALGRPGKRPQKNEMIALEKAKAHSLYVPHNQVSMHLPYSMEPDSSHSSVVFESLDIGIDVT